MKREKLAAAFFATVMVLGLAASAGAVDGVIEINQAKVLASPGGFPYGLASGSYRLTGNLTVPASTTGIQLSGDNITIDLNGFSITGPGCNGGSLNPSFGINGSGNSTTVENGTITGFAFGLNVGSDASVRSVHVSGNCGGIIAGGGAVIQGCTANGNASGISCGSGCLVSGNTIDNNTGTPMFFSDSTSGYEGNVLNGNASKISGGTSLGQNLCNGSAC